ncbi:hypothetical protein CROQUDRAFT_135353 [Cronartium quercuum f. sp. fusiforme G11]|uniref:Uncharacterized protein n=1 Tax=Cronartium quercuum f. sp. fusiforme G11 TaxID=708437 RepID=A0A9P6NER6_9BASI|nr:hypothetical protein CROQUDRAFT_135353 [Cronartium quercuum f. sp. fusiforme G11]
MKSSTHAIASLTSRLFKEVNYFLIGGNSKVSNQLQIFLLCIPIKQGTVFLDHKLVKSGVKQCKNNQKIGRTGMIPFSGGTLGRKGTYNSMEATAHILEDVLFERDKEAIGFPAILSTPVWWERERNAYENMRKECTYMALKFQGVHDESLQPIFDLTVKFQVMAND